MIKSRFSYAYFAKIALLIFTVFSILLLVSGSAMAAYPDYSTFSAPTGTYTGWTGIYYVEDLKAIGDNAAPSANHPMQTAANWAMTSQYVLMSDIIIDEATWDSIGDSSIQFNGTIDGNGYSITFGGVNESITFTNLDAGSGFGLFGRVANNTIIQNLTVIVAADLNSNNNASTGVIVGSMQNTTAMKFDNCTVKFNDFYSLTGNLGVGGLGGNIRYTTITNSTVIGGSINGTSEVGGFIGSSNINITINNSQSSASIVSIASNGAGGFIGKANGSSINNSNTTGDVTGRLGVGGFIGNATEDVVISNSYSTGNISATRLSGMNQGSDGYYAGGLIGRTYGIFNITNCYSTGNISGQNSIGGLVGESQNTSASVSITQSYATGNVHAILYPGVDQSGSTAGGLVGRLFYGNISQSYSTGDVEADVRFAGGLIGRIDNGADITDCYSTSSVFAHGISGASFRDGRHAGGLIGYVLGSSGFETNLTNSYAAGQTVYALHHSAGGLIGSINDSTTIMSTIPPELQATVNIVDCYSLVTKVFSASLSGKIIGDIDPTQIGTSTFSDIRVWDNMTIAADSNDTVIQVIVDATEPVSKVAVYKNEAGWPTFDFSTIPIWEMSTTNYGLPVFVWQIEEPNMVPMYESRSGGSGTGGAVISNNGSTPVVQTPAPEPTQTPQTQESIQTPTPEPISQPAPQPVDSKISIWWYICLIALIILIVGIAVYFVKVRKN